MTTQPPTPYDARIADPHFKARQKMRYKADGYRHALADLGLPSVEAGEALIAERDAWRNALLGLTDGGSEFEASPSNCVWFVKRFTDEANKVAVAKVKLLANRDATIKALTEALTDVQNQVKNMLELSYPADSINEDVAYTVEMALAAKKESANG